MKKSVETGRLESMKAWEKEIDRRSRHTQKALRILGVKPEQFGFRVLGPRSLMLNEHAETHMTDLTVGLALGMTDTITKADKKKALAELLLTLDQGVVSALLSKRH